MLFTSFFCWEKKPIIYVLFTVPRNTIERNPTILLKSFSKKLPLPPISHSTPFSTPSMKTSAAFSKRSISPSKTSQLPSLLSQKKFQTPSSPTSSSSCGGYFSAATGRITSPNYPSNYDNDADCTYVIHTVYSSHVEIYLEYMDIDSSSFNYCFDKLIVSNELLLL